MRWNCASTRHVIITDEVNFHSDLYIVEAMAKLAGRDIVVKTIDRETLTNISTTTSHWSC